MQVARLLTAVSDRIKLVGIAVGFFGYLVMCAVLIVAVPTGALYLLTRFVKWAWMND